MPPSPKRPDSGALKVLFIGNSFTSRNDLPGLIARLADAAGRSLAHHLISAGGASLRRHWNHGAAREEIARGGYDYVVLQEQSTLPIKNPQRMRENVLLFDDAIKAAGARTALYMTWARRHAPQTQQAITDAYTSIAQEIGASLIPAGVAWQAFLKQYDEPVLYDSDGSHPTLAGSYLAACVAFAVLFDASPVSPIKDPIEGLTREQISRLHQMAASVRK